MKGVILAGGLGTRLRPLTLVTNKHLLPVYDRPMIFYPLETLVRAGLADIMIVVGGPHAGHFLPVIGNGRKFGVKHLEYAYQEKEGGIAEALSLTEDFADGQDVCVILGDNTTDADMSREIKKFRDGALVFLREVADPQRFGVPTFDPADPSRIVKITEKPARPDSNYAVTGLYLYDRRVYDFIRKTVPSARGEREITDVNNQYVAEGSLRWAKLEGFWHDAGEIETLFDASAYWAEKARSGRRR